MTAVAALLAVALAAPAMADADVSVAASGPDGMALYQEHCAGCHGKTGRADGFNGRLMFARNFSKEKWQAETSDAAILKAITEGARMMPAYAQRLTPEQQQSLLPVIRGFAQP